MFFSPHIINRLASYNDLDMASAGMNQPSPRNLPHPSPDAVKNYSTFEIFFKLPPELRLKIWNAAIDDISPRYLTAECKLKGASTPALLHVSRSLINNIAWSTPQVENN